MFIQFARNSVITSGIPHEVEEYFSASMNNLFMDGIVWIWTVSVSLCLSNQHCYDLLSLCDHRVGDGSLEVLVLYQSATYYGHKKREIVVVTTLV